MSGAWSRSRKPHMASSTRPARHAAAGSGCQRQVCRAFERGHCRDGPTCRFSHEVARTRVAFGRGRSGLMADIDENNTNESLFKNSKEIDYWLQNQLLLDASENIEQLSGEKGLRVLSQVVERRNLSTESIGLFVKLLVKEEVRASLLREKTNKIYGALLGSPFLLQLHAHIASHVWNPTRGPTADDLWPYLLLTEELQSRTAEGWKEVPLDALQSVVSRLEESPAKDDLVAIASRLIDQRANLQRKLAVAPPEKCLQGARFREESILPGKAELFRMQARQDLPVNRIGMRFSRVSDYLETHFQLLKEDCTDPLRQGIKAYRSNHSLIKGNSTDLRIYAGVKLFGVQFGEKGVEHVFQISAKVKDPQQWESSKQLMSGALLCVSSDHFDTFFWGVVASRDIKNLSKGLVAIRVMGESDANVTAGLQRGQNSTKTYVMVESTTAYFEAYYHVLKALQRTDMEDIPFTKYLLSLESSVKPPSYLLRRKGGDEFDFSCVFPDIQQKLGRKSIRIMQSWPSGWADSLDRAQLEALKQGLTKELAIIQGPPGTGKTFLGLILVKLLLANLQRSAGHDSRRPSRWRGAELGVMNEKKTHDISGPILIICYTNHALDQFLEGIYRNGETNLIRIGGRSKSEFLKDQSLQNLVQKQRTEHEVKGSHRRFSGQARGKKDEIQEDIENCIRVMGTNLVTATQLNGIATPEQIQSLFWSSNLKDGPSKKIAELWLNEDEYGDGPDMARHFFVNENESSQTVEATEKPKRERMIPLPKSAPHEYGEWVEARPRRDRRQARRENLAEGLEIVHDNPEGHNVAVGANALAAQGNEYPRPRNGLNIAEGGGPEDEEYRLQDLLQASNVWELNLRQRRKLHEYWVQVIRKNQRSMLTKLTKRYEEACLKAVEVDYEVQLSLLRKSKVVGMTTTGAAKYHDVLKALKSEIIIVEEAAEVLEGHILASLSPSVKHLILIGDHLQLRPSVAVYRLSTEHKLDISMFERLVRSGVEHITLQEQRRMRPSISKLMRTLYPDSRDHESVTSYEDVKGVKSNVFFFNHKASEDNVRDAASKQNSTEARLVVEFCIYLLNQGCYKPQNIAILSMYTGQLVEIKALLREKCDRKFLRRAVGASSQPEGEETEVPRVSSVDDYQGEESDIIILSLVRSNAIVTDEGVGKIGFLKIPNRICVAMTRAKKGLFIFGNAELLAERSTLWDDVTSSLLSDGQLGPKLELYCQNHPETITGIVTADDFKQVEDGGCSLPCEFQLDCGHACPRRCHPGSHDLAVCPKPCLRQYAACSHICNLRCHGSNNCPPCKVIVAKQMPGCDHQQRMECYTDVKDAFCRSDCPKILECGHQCRKFCGRPCTGKYCQEKVTKVLPCGHSARISCHQDPTAYSCEEPCVVLLEDCKHRCKGTCGKCKRCTSHIPCQNRCGRSLPCGHVCEAGCSLSCPPCPKRCQKRCFHSRCSDQCGNVCKPCLESCSWQCEHHKCEKRCHEMCTRPRCNLPCTKLIPKCKHPCIGLCGEPCPTKCRVCHPETLDIITLMKLKEYEDADMFVQLEDCGHVFEVSGLDTWMDESNEIAQQADGTTSEAIKLKECPECRTLIWRSHRYSNVVKKKHLQVEDVKRRVKGFEKTRRGSLLLQQGDAINALSSFRKALRDYPGLMEARFGIGCTFGFMREYAKAIEHFSFIVERSSFSSVLADLITSDGKNKSADLVEKVCRSSLSRAGDSIAMEAIVEWAVVLTKVSGETKGALELCDAVLGRDPKNSRAKEVKEKVNNKRSNEVLEVAVKAMAREVGGRGHWFTCPNGHYYCIGECGGAMEVSKCPDCNAQVGGQSHRLLAGNAPIDGSGTSAWPGN